MSRDMVTGIVSGRGQGWKKGDDKGVRRRAME